MWGVLVEMLESIEHNKTNQNANSYRGQTRFIHTRVLVEMLEYIENLFTQWKTSEYYRTTAFISAGMLLENVGAYNHLVQATTMEKQVLLMRGCRRNCWKNIEHFQKIWNRKVY